MHELPNTWALVTEAIDDESGFEIPGGVDLLLAAGPVRRGDRLFVMGTAGFRKLVHEIVAGSDAEFPGISRAAVLAACPPAPFFYSLMTGAFYRKPVPPTLYSQEGVDG